MRIPFSYHLEDVIFDFEGRLDFDVEMMCDGSLNITLVDVYYNGPGGEERRLGNSELHTAIFRAVDKLASEDLRLQEQAITEAGWMMNAEPNDPSGRWVRVQ